jgi:hypothetical protein
MCHSTCTSIRKRGRRSDEGLSPRIHGPEGLDGVQGGGDECELGCWKVSFRALRIEKENEEFPDSNKTLQIKKHYYREVQPEISSASLSPRPYSNGIGDLL